MLKPSRKLANETGRSIFRHLYKTYFDFSCGEYLSPHAHFKMVLLENESFLSELTKLFQRSRTSGAVMLTMKKYDGRTKPKPKKTDASDHTEYRCLLRATLGNRKISTVVSQKDVNKFQMAYANLLKGNMDGLKKRDKKSAKGKKAKATQ